MLGHGGGYHLRQQFLFVVLVSLQVFPSVGGDEFLGLRADHVCWCSHLRLWLVLLFTVIVVTSTFILRMFLEYLLKLIIINQWHSLLLSTLLLFLLLLLLLLLLFLALAFILPLIIPLLLLISSRVRLRLCLVFNGSIVELFDVGCHLGVCLVDGVPDLVDVCEELMELGEHVEELSDSNNTKLLAFPLSPYSLKCKLESNILQSAINNTMLDDSTKEFSYLFQILLWVSMQESVLIK